ncbi:MAG: hypothetical protein L0Y71_07125 [Gemmataceae bacterium]|nr:hypothetical protein [Gemmataceae bacterium]
MHSRFSRQRLVGGLIVALAVTLCVAPLFSGEQAESPELSDVSGGVRHAVNYPPADHLPPPAPTDNRLPAATSIGIPTDGVFAPPPVRDTSTREHVVESKSFQLVSTKYRLTTGKAKALAQFLDEQIGRPEIFEISVEDPEAITVVASPSAQETVGKLVNLMRTSPGKSRESRPVASEADLQRQLPPR